MNTIRMGVVPSPDKYSEVVEYFGTLIEPLLQVQIKPYSLPNGVVTLNSNIIKLEPYHVFLVL